VVPNGAVPNETVPDDVGLPPLADRVTRPVPIVVPDDADAAAAPVTAWDRIGRARDVGPTSGGPGRRRPGRAGRIGRIVGGRRRRAGIATGLAVATAVAGVAVAVTYGAVTTVEAGPAAAPAPDPGAGSAAGPASATTTAAPTGLEAELTRALMAIGRSRAAAFRRASERYLAGADVTGSPAYLADLALVQRLRSQGYRLQGVRYQVSGLRVLNRRGQLVDVRATVTTSEHRQVRVSTGVGVPVPQDGPRPIVLTVAPVDLNRAGPGRWRVRSIEVAS
jgi:hypothetical protein